MKRSALYTAIAKRLSFVFEECGAPARPLFFAATPWDPSDNDAHLPEHTAAYYPVNVRGFGKSDIHLPREDPQIRILAACFMAAIAEWEEKHGAS